MGKRLHRQPRWVRVASYSRQEEARLVAGRLEAEGIEARVFPEAVMGFYGTRTHEILQQGIDVLVPEDRREEALALIQEIG
jgi:hypothetical protein